MPSPLACRPHPSPAPDVTLSTPVFRALAGLALAAGVAFLARRARALSTSGALAALVVGTAAVAAGWSFGAVLVVYFVASSALSRWKDAVREARTGAIVEKGGARDAVQVAANGALFALGAASTLGGVRGAAALALGALAAAASDTWATEIGTVAGRTPRSIVTGRIVAPGTSGGVTLAGLAGALLGAGLVPAVAWTLGAPPPLALAAFAGGVAGSTADSLLGALLQAQRWCDRCERATERRVHDCGTPTTHRRGIAWLQNDAVNFVATVVGGAVAWALFLR